MGYFSNSLPTFGHRGLGRHGFWRALSAVTPPGPPTPGAALLLEDGFYLLLEDGVSHLLLEVNN